MTYKTFTKNESRLISHQRKKRKFDNNVHIACICTYCKSNLFAKVYKKGVFINNRTEKFYTLAHQKYSDKHQICVSNVWFEHLCIL